MPVHATCFEGGRHLSYETESIIFKTQSNISLVKFWPTAQK